MWALCLQMPAEPLQHHVTQRASPLHVRPTVAVPRHHRCSQPVCRLPSHCYPQQGTHTAPTQRSHGGAAWSWGVQENLSGIQTTRYEA